VQAESAAATTTTTTTTMVWRQRGRRRKEGDFSPSVTFYEHFLESRVKSLLLLLLREQKNALARARKIHADGATIETKRCTNRVPMQMT
jgi:hypothetical protein